MLPEMYYNVEVNKMIRKAFRMKLFDGMAEEYRRRHNLIWREMVDMIHEYGGS